MLLRNMELFTLNDVVDRFRKPGSGSASKRGSISPDGVRSLHG